MKWVFGVLVLVNAGVALWAVAHKDVLSDRPFPVRVAINPDAMRLVVEPTPSTTAGASVGPCFRIGPFLDYAQLTLATQKLDALSVRHSEISVDARQIRAYRVYLGPFSALTDAQGAEQRLGATGISDHYLKQEDPGAIVSLGLFSQKLSAETLARQLSDQGFTAQVRSEDRTLGPTYWLELPDQAANDRVGSALRDTPWGDQRSQLREIRCG